MESNKIAKILSIDIGGNNVKTAVLSKEGKLLTEYKKLPTPRPATPQAVIKTIQRLAKGLAFDAISVGFPGYVKEGVVHTAPNLGTDFWSQCAFADLLTKTFSKPARVVNDADMQGLGLVSGKGFEMVVTLGTGFGTAFLRDGILLPHMEIAHHPIVGKKDYDKFIGEKALKKIGKKEWNKRMQLVLSILKAVFNYNTLYLGGGNAKKLAFKLDENIKIVTNIEGVNGGAKLWAQ